MYENLPNFARGGAIVSLQVLTIQFAAKHLKMSLVIAILPTDLIKQVAATKIWTCWDDTLLTKPCFCEFDKIYDADDLISWYYEYNENRSLRYGMTCFTCNIIHEGEPVHYVSCINASTDHVWSCRPFTRGDCKNIPTNGTGASIHDGPALTKLELFNLVE